MGFRFEGRGNIGQQVRKIAEEQFDKAIADSQGDKEFGDAVHSARRRCKRLRGLLRLIRPVFDDFEGENAALRDAADGLSGARDAAVVVDTFKALRAFDGEQQRPAKMRAETANAVGRLLEERTRSHEGDSQAEILSAFRATMEAGRKRAAAWELDGDGFSMIGEGLEATYSRMGKRLRKAADTKTETAFHDWRKDAKYHWHHVGLFEPASPDLLGPRKRSLDRLGELLGDHHNLAVLSEVLANEAGSIDGEQIATIGDVIAEEQAGLEAAALTLGRQLAAEKPAALRDRFHAYWNLLPVDD